MNCEDEEEQEEEEEEEYDCPEDHAYVSDCTCDHEREQHGWVECEVEGCECEGHWEY